MKTTAARQLLIDVIGKQGRRGLVVVGEARGAVSWLIAQRPRLVTYGPVLTIRGGTLERGILLKLSVRGLARTSEFLS
jgi:hypothetical protein